VGYPLSYLDELMLRQAIWGPLSNYYFESALTIIMGSLKRKEGPGGPSTSKSVQTTSESRPSKRPKPSDSVRDDSKTTEKKGKGRRQPKSSDPKATTAPTVSLLKEDEPLFPRGGGSILTPFEQKQIQVQAKNDVLFEQESGSSAKKAEKGAKKKKRRSEGPSIQVRDEDAVKIESLNFKVSCPSSFPGCTPNSR